MLARCLLLGCLFAVASPSAGEEPSTGDPDFESLEESFEFWVGKHNDEVAAALGKPRKSKPGNPYSTVVWRYEVTCAAIHGPHRVEIRGNEDPDVYGGGTYVYVVPVQGSIFGQTVGERHRVAFRVDQEGYVRGFDARLVKKKKCPEDEH